MNTNELRKHIRAQRLHLTPKQQQTASVEVCQHALRLNRYKLSEHIALYLAYQGEIDPQAIIDAAHTAGKKCYLPVLHPRAIGQLCFLPYTPGDKLVENKFGILEPEYHAEKTFPAWHLDIVFAPLVAFDRDGNRLGMGKGYYDRTFEFIHQRKDHKPYFVGLAYHMQKVEQLVPNAHDVRLHEIITEQGLILG